MKSDSSDADTLIASGAYSGGQRAVFLCGRRATKDWEGLHEETRQKLTKRCEICCKIQDPFRVGKAKRIKDGPAEVFEITLGHPPIRAFAFVENGDWHITQIVSKPPDAGYIREAEAANAIRLKWIASKTGP